MPNPSRPGSSARRAAARGPRLRRLVPAAGLSALFLGVALWQTSPAFEGHFLADDQSYIVHNAYVHELSWENLLGILDPRGEPTAYTANYAPVHLLLHALEYSAFGPSDMTGWHAVNAVTHAATTLVLVAFFLRCGLAPVAAWFGGAVFLTHPANMETVAWIFQLKTLVSLGLALGALLWLERRSAAATGLFSLALLTKITAVFALPVAAVQAWIRGRDGFRLPWGSLAAWSGVALVVTVLEFQAYGVQEDPRTTIHEDLLVHARTIVAIAMRYLMMAYTTWGLSTFHEPAPVISWLDPWWIAGAVALTGLGWRTAVTLRRRDPEAIFWVFAASSFVPVSQIVPFAYPMGDRYLYPILPGLIGGTLLALRGPAAWLRQRNVLPPEALLRVGAAAAAILVLTLLAVRSHDRAPVFRTMRTMMVDAALHYPDGVQAHLLRGTRAAKEGDAEASAASYQRAVELGFSDLHSLTTSPSLARVRDHPAFRALIRDLAARNAARIERREDPSQMELVALGRAYRVRGELRRAEDAFERALEHDGPLRPTILRQLREIRRELAASRR